MYVHCVAKSLVKMTLLSKRRFPWSGDMLDMKSVKWATDIDMLYEIRQMCLFNKEFTVLKYQTSQTKDLTF